MSKKDNQSLRGQTLRRESTSHGITLSRHDVLEASHTRRVSPLLAGCPLGSLPARAIRLPDKEFRYLRTVIVTAAVHRGFSSKRKPLPLTFRHRAGVSPYTSTFVLAQTYVFGKQLLGLLSCGPLIVLTTVQETQLELFSQR